MLLSIILTQPLRDIFIRNQNTLAGELKYYSLCFISNGHFYYHCILDSTNYSMQIQIRANSSKFEQLVLISSSNSKKRICHIRKRTIPEQYKCINLLTALSLCPFIYLKEMKMKFHNSLKTCFFLLLLMY